jgi:hypothetical protein
MSYLLFFTFPISEVQGFGVSANQYWFFIQEPSTIDFPEMFFSVMNDESFSIQVNCTYERIEGINVSVGFQWESIILEANAKRSNRYSISVYDSFNVTFPVRIFCTAKPLDNSSGQKVIPGVIVLNQITYYSDKTGYHLALQVMDQSSLPREATIIMNHKYNDSVGYTPIKKVNASNIQGYFPQGWYQVIAIDLETSIVAETQFYFDNDTIIFLELQLVGFSQFELISDNKNHVGVNATINNFVEMLYDVEIYAELYLDGELLSVSDSKDKILPLFPEITDYGIKTWFNFEDWEITEYVVIGKIYSANQFIASKFKILPINEVPPENQLNPILLIAVGSFIGIAGTIIFMEFNRRRMAKKYDLSQDSSK